MSDEIEGFLQLFQIVARDGEFVRLVERRIELALVAANYGEAVGVDDARLAYLYECRRIAEDGLGRGAALQA